LNISHTVAGRSGVTISAFFLVFGGGVVGGGVVGVAVGVLVVTEGVTFCASTCCTICGTCAGVACSGVAVAHTAFCSGVLWSY